MANINASARVTRRVLAVSCLGNGSGVSTRLTVGALFATVVLLLLILSSSSLIAATYAVPEDRELIMRSDVIGIMTAIGSHTELAPGGIVRTVYEMQLDEVLKGPVQRGATIQLVERGGTFGGVATMIPGSPVYRKGRQYLVFAETNRDGDLQTWGMQIGRFVFDNIGGRKIFTHGGSELFGFDHNDDPYVDRPRDAAGFLEYIRGIVNQTIDPAPTYFLEPAKAEATAVVTSNHKATVNFTGTSYIMAAGNFPFRWQNPSYSFVLSGSASPLDGTGGANGAVGAWDGAGAGVNVSISGQDNTATAGLTGVDGKNAILFNDPNNELPSGADGIGGVTNASSQYSYEGGMVWQPSEVDVVMGKNSVFSNQSCFNSVITHEVGHTLAMRHSDRNTTDDGPCAAPLDCASIGSALMATVTECSFNGALQAWDLRAIQTVYGSAPVCTQPSITTQPVGTSINSGQSATLSVAASGTTPFSYQWYIGTPPTTTSPVGGATSSSVNVSPTSTTSYWVRVTNSCGSTNSNAATVTVNASCPAVAVGTPTATQISGGFQLSVSASTGTGGGTLTYNWFAGGVFVGGGNPITVNPSSQTSYTVKVTNGCGNSATSAPVTVTPSSTCPAVTVGTPTATKVSNGFQLSVSASTGTGGGSLTFSWFAGSLFVGGGNPIVVNPSSQTTYSVFVSNGCGNSATSPPITVTPTATCNAPAIAATSATPSSITSGGSSTLSVTATGTSLNYQWYTGQPGDTSHPISGGNSATVNVSPTQTTTYWVQVSSGCGAAAANSGAIVVTVASACATPTLTQPPDQLVGLGQIAFLTVSATGTAPLHYAWFQGSTGDTSKPVGTDSATLRTDSLRVTTTFWVRVTNGCGSTANSSTITITVRPSRFRPSRH